MIRRDRWGWGFTQGFGEGAGWPQPSDYLLNDQFLTPEAAPLTTPRTAEPGGGIEDITDPSNEFSISSQRLNYAAGDSKGVWETGGITRASGLAMFVHTNQSTRHVAYFGFDNEKTGSPAAGAFVSRESFDWDVFVTPTFIDTKLALNASTDYTIAVILRTVGAYFPIKIGADWILAWVDNTLSNSPVFPCISAVAVVVGYTEYLKSLQLLAPFNTDYDIATERLAGARTAGDTFTHEADCLIEEEVATIPSGGQHEIAFRMQDATNYWQVTVDSAGDIDLDEVVAGSPTERGTDAAVVANSDRIVIICDDDVIRVYQGDVLSITYSSATNFKTATAGKLIDEGTGGAITDIISWPRVLSGLAKSVLDKAEVG